MNIIGLDIGGANLKAANREGRAIQAPFALWKSPGDLANQVKRLLEPWDTIDQIALTMTGELCDCFDSKSAGVRHIVASVNEAADRRPVRVWTVDGVFLDAAAIDREPLRAAASNWFALAAYAGRMVPRGAGLVIDLGSTTCDVIPLFEGRPIPVGRTDPDRMASGELVYCGVRRTPLCAVYGLTKAAEWFATTEDAFVVLGELPEAPERIDTADNRPVTRANARSRLARMECDEGWSWERAEQFAQTTRDLLVLRLAESVRRVSDRLAMPPSGVVAAGAGEFLIADVLRSAGFDSVPVISLASRFGPHHSTAACALAVAILAGETS